MTPPQWAVDLASRTGRDVADVLERYEERAAVREYLGGQGRREAEQAAVVDVVEVMGG